MIKTNKQLSLLSVITKFFNRKKTLSPYYWRHLGVNFIILFVIFLILSRIFYLQITNRHFLQYQGDQRSVRLVSKPAYRGIIFDRNGTALAVSTPVVSVWANPGELITAKDRWSELASLLKIKKAILLKKLKASSHLDFIYLKRHLALEVAQKILDKKIYGVYGIREFHRYYPAAAVTAQLIGMTNIDDQGQSGLELMYNDWLSGTPGKERVVRDLLGHAIDKTECVKSADPGKPLYLSIDLRLQYLAYRELLQTVEKYDASSGTIVMMEPNSGEVLAMVTFPSFNSNNRSEYSPQAARNRTITDQYEPGSTMKAFTIASALNSTLFTPQTTIDTSPGWMLVNGYTIKDTRNFGQLNTQEVLIRSSNIGASKIAFAIGQQRLVDMLGDFGFGKLTGVNFPGEMPGYVPFKKKLSKVGLSNLSFGYHISATPLQMVRGYSGLASGGILPTASLLKQDDSVKKSRVISYKNAQDIVDMLKQAVERGTGKKAQITGYTVAGKTGTSHKAGIGGYNKKSYYSSFIGIVPASAPKLVMLVMFNNVKKGSYYGGQVAGPVFSRVAGTALRLLGIPPDKPFVKTLE